MGHLPQPSPFCCAAGSFAIDPTPSIRDNQLPLLATRTPAVNSSEVRDPMNRPHTLPNKYFGKWIFLAASFLMLALPQATHAFDIDLKPPGPREFILDKAHLLTEEDATKIREICDQLLTQKGTPIVVVTIESMADYGGAGLRIETFATLLFDQWGIGQAKLNGQDWNTGILLLVARDDRKARIELGAGWGRREDMLCSQIMNQQIIPLFKSGEYSQGILAGVEALDKMARKLELPAAQTPPATTTQKLLAVGAIALAIFTVVSLIRRGNKGWAWLFWGLIFGVIAAILYQMATSQNRGGGGFSGGSFGGGFSGGGGASGSW